MATGKALFLELMLPPMLLAVVVVLLVALSFAYIWGTTPATEIGYLPGRYEMNKLTREYKSITINEDGTVRAIDKNGMPVNGCVGRSCK